MRPGWAPRGAGVGYLSAEQQAGPALGTEEPGRGRCAGRAASRKEWGNMEAGVEWDTRHMGCNPTPAERRTGSPASPPTHGAVWAWRPSGCGSSSAGMVSGAWTLAAPHTR